MKAARVLPPLLISIAVHAALIALLPWQSRQQPSPGIMRVTLRPALVTPAPQAQVEKPSQPEPPAREPRKEPPAPKPKPARAPAAARPTAPQPSKTTETSKPEQPPRPANDAQASAPAASEPEAAGAATGAPEALPEGGEPSPPAPVSPRVIDVEELTALKKTLPEYPQLSRRRREEGTVTLLIEIEQGRVAAAKVERGSGYTPLDESALRAVRQWRFAVLDMPVTARVRIAFSLNEN